MTIFPSNDPLEAFLRGFAGAFQQAQERKAGEAKEERQFARQKELQQSAFEQQKDLIRERTKAQEKTDPEIKQTINANKKLISGIRSDAKKAKSLLRESEGVESAITSGNVLGEGAGALARSAFRWIKGQTTTKDEQRLDTVRKRSLIELGDTKGIRLTDAKLRLLEESLFKKGKSEEANLEAYRIWKDTLQERIIYADVVNELTQEENAFRDPALEQKILDLTAERFAELKQQEALEKQPKESPEERRKRLQSVLKG